MVSTATGISPFECSLGYRPLMFPQQETEVAVPSAREQLRQCRRMWSSAHAALLWANDRSQHSSNWRCIPAPVCLRGQSIWLLAKDLPIPTSSRKLGLCYVGPYCTQWRGSSTPLRCVCPCPHLFGFQAKVGCCQCPLHLSQLYLHPVSPKMVTQFSLYGGYCVIAAGEGVSSF